MSIHCIGRYVHRWYIRIIATVMIVLTLVVGCGKAQPTVTPAPPSATPTEAPPTATPLPPTHTPVPPPATSMPPTPIPTPTMGRIAFYSEGSAKAEIYTIGADGSELQRLTSNRAEDMCPAFSHDGSKIAFCSDRSGNHEIYVMDSDGSNPIRLTNTPEREYQPAWSPDGKHIAFTRYACASWDCGEIFVMNADGSDVRQLTDHPGDDMRPVWSPDGTKILYNSKRDGNYEIFIVNPDGSDQQRLTHTPTNEMFPILSPDGTKIAYALVDFQTFAAEVHVMNVDGTDDTTLASEGRINESPIWSPDGSKIVFQTDRTGNFEIYVMNADGSEQTNLSNSSQNDYWPSWAPMISSNPAGAGVEPEENGLYLGQTPPGLDVQVFAPGVVSIEEGKEYKITFSPDLREIYFTRRTPGGRDERLWYSRLENGRLTMPELAPFAYDCLESDACFTPDGKRLYFNSWRPLPGEDALSNRHNVWFVDKTEEGWSEPQLFDSPINDYRPVYFSIANNGTIYFTCSSPREICYAELQGGQYSAVKRLPDEINDLRDVAHPAIAPDESYIIVDSCYYQGGRLVGSLYISFKKPDGSWTQATSMRDVLQASESDVYAAPRITPDGKYLFFEDYVKDTDQADICWVSTEVIEALRSEALE